MKRQNRYSGFSMYGPSDIIGIGPDAFRLPDTHMQPRVISRTTAITTFGGRGNLLDDVSADIMRRIRMHEEMIFRHVAEHNRRVHDHHRRMTYHHPHHSESDHPLHRRERF